MFSFKPKKVFEKLNKMDRKQAYTIGAIAVVSIIALLMLVSAMSSTTDDSFDGLATRGYDLATLPFATDGAEQYLLAAKYPDMKENGSTLLYSAQEKEARQQEDAQSADEDASGEESASQYDDNTSAARSDNGGYAGYSGGGYRGGAGGGKTEVGKLSSTGMATAGGSGISSTFGPTGDFRQFKGREDRGDGAPAQLRTGNARQALAQFRQGSRAAAAFKENRMTGVRKALLGGNVAGSEAITKDGVDLSKLEGSGLTLDTDAPPSTTDLDNLDKKVADAAKKAEEKKKEEDKKSWWEDMLIGLAKSAADTLVNSFMNTVGDTIGDTMKGNSASRAARKQYGAEMAGKEWNADGSCKENCLTQEQTWALAKNGVTSETWAAANTKQQTKMGSQTTGAWVAGNEAKTLQMGSTDTAKMMADKNKNNNNNGGTNVCHPKKPVYDKDGKLERCE